MQTKTLFFTSAFVFFTTAFFAQEQAFHSEKNAQPSELVAYLFTNYGTDATEALLLKIRAYETGSGKKVLAPGIYLQQVEKLDAEIIACNDAQRVHELQARKNQLVPITTIEKLFH